MSKIYVIGQGEYSDFGVVAAFTDKAVAERIVAEINKDREYNTLCLITLALDVEPEVWTSYRAEVKVNGEIRKWESQEVDWHEPDYPNKEPRAQENVLVGKTWTSTPGKDQASTAAPRMIITAPSNARRAQLIDEALRRR